MINIQLNEFSADGPITQVHDFNDDQEDDDNEEEAESETSLLVPQTPSHSVSNSGALQAWRTLLKQHYPWSISDPGPPSLLILEVSDKKHSFSTPFLKGELPQQKLHKDQHRTLLETDSNNKQLAGRFGTVTRVILPRKLGSKAFLRWMFIVLNVAFEVLQAVLAQVMDQGKKDRKIYLKLSIITSSVCLIMSLVEAFHEARNSRVVWQKRGYCCWFYYPGIEGRLFGRFSLYFGIICSMIQFVLNLMKNITRKDSIKFDAVPLLLSVCYFGAALIAARKKDSSFAIVKCKTHGYNVTEAEAMIVDGQKSQVYECSDCRIENLT